MKIRYLTALAQSAALMPWLGRLATLAMLALLAWLGAEIFWTVNAPAGARPSALLETDLQRAQQAIVSRHLFGQYIAVAEAAAAPSNLKLSGVIAAQKPGQRAYALITVEGKTTQLVKEGEEVAPGITLQRVLARQVELMRGGRSQTLSLPENAKALPAGAGEAAKAVAAAEASLAPAPEPAKPQVAAATPIPPAVTAPLLQGGPIPTRRGRSRRSTEDE